MKLAMARWRSQDLIPTRYSLLSRLEDWDDAESWKEFFDIYWRLIYSLALQSGLTETEAQDVVQETVMTVARDIHKFKRDRALGSFKGWLRRIIRWRIIDQFRKRNPEKPEPEIWSEGDDSSADLNRIPDTSSTELEMRWEEEWRANLFETALERVKRQVRDEHFQIFDLYVVKSWPALKVARTLSVSVGRVYLAKHRIAALIKKEIQILEKKLF
jgi:RNA polymerase sigma-70 factor (ECF subfamily)